MHPNANFRWEDRDAMRAFVADASFGMLFCATPDGLRVAHIPVVFDGDDALVFHLARGNALTRQLNGASALFTLLGPQAYVSPDWYGTGPDEVPTWNYIAVELEGRVTKLHEDAVLAQIDALSKAQEARLAPKPEWLRAKVDPSKIVNLLKGISGFRLEITAWRGTLKLGQTKPEAARLAVADALDEHGRSAIALLTRKPPQ